MIYLQYAAMYCLAGFVTVFLVSVRDILKKKNHWERVALNQVFLLWPGFAVAITCQLLSQVGMATGYVVTELIKIISSIAAEEVLKEADREYEDRFVK